MNLCLLQRPHDLFAFDLPIFKKRIEIALRAVVDERDGEIMSLPGPELLLGDRTPVEVADLEANGVVMAAPESVVVLYIVDERDLDVLIECDFFRRHRVGDRRIRIEHEIVGAVGDDEMLLRRAAIGCGGTLVGMGVGTAVSRRVIRLRHRRGKAVDGLRSSVGCGLERQQNRGGGRREDEDNQSEHAKG
jgi:hypothetical protein